MIPVSILGATGAVGQKLVRLLADHPWFEVASVCASERSAGRRFGEVVRWLEPGAPPERVARMAVERAEPGVAGRIAFSALDAAAAEAIEPRFAAAGCHVVTNAKSRRQDPDVPLVIPEVNPGALELLTTQRRERGWDGSIVANPNCSVVVLASVLAPLQAAFGVERVFAATLQAVSGAGYPGVPALDALGNVVPFIPGEEEKFEPELHKLLGTRIPVSVHVNRVPVVDGHTVVLSVELEGHPTAPQVLEALASFQVPDMIRGLPTAPDPFLYLLDAEDRPQPRLDAGLGGGMAISVGRVRSCPILDVRLVALGHNTIRGAAGAALLNAELLVAQERVS